MCSYSTQVTDFFLCCEVGGRGGPRTIHCYPQDKLDDIKGINLAPSVRLRLAKFIDNHNLITDLLVIEVIPVSKELS